jgi:hypothetical protein
MVMPTAGAATILIIVPHGFQRFLMDVSDGFCVIPPFVTPWMMELLDGKAKGLETIVITARLLQEHCFTIVFLVGHQRQQRLGKMLCNCRGCDTTMKFKRFSDWFLLSPGHGCANPIDKSP